MGAIGVDAGGRGTVLCSRQVQPTIQRWFSWTSHPRSQDPFFLYAASNVGSLLALLAYPLVVEPAFGLITQASIFRWLYLALLVVATGLVVRVRPVVHAGKAAVDRISWDRRLRWVAWAAVPSLGLLAVTRHIATDVASFPLLWVVPLAHVHLLTLEAMKAYSDSIGEQGVIGFDISNRHFDLEPVIGRVAAELGLSARATHFAPNDQDGAPTSFVIVARNSSDLTGLDGDWQPARVGDDLWTDDFSDLLGVLR